jgi:hypothetical protein
MHTLIREKHPFRPLSKCHSRQTQSNALLGFMSDTTSKARYLLEGGLGKIAVIFNNPHWINLCNLSQHSRFRWAIDFRFGSINGSKLSETRGVSMHLGGYGHLPTTGTETWKFGMHPPDCEGSVYRSFHNSVRDGDIIIAPSCSTNYIIAVSGNLESPIIGEDGDSSFRGNGSVDLDYVSIRGMKSDSEAVFIERLSQYYEVSSFRPPVDGNSFEYSDGKWSREMIFYPISKPS